jgi:hypothetical protein
LRLGTYRLMMTTDGISEYHHNETDERVFEYLVNSVSENWYDYSLGGKDIISRLRLSRENYDDALFIHPPFFVYSSAVLQKFLGISLPSISLIYHFGVLLMIPLMVNYSGFDVGDQLRQHKWDRRNVSHRIGTGDGTGTIGYSNAAAALADDAEDSSDDEAMIAPPVASFNSNFSQGAVSLWAAAIYITDPLAFFCSQKFWIDNALLFCVTLSATIHMITWRRRAVRVKRSNLRLFFRSFFSGLMYGILVLNCKVTGLALLPFMLTWMCTCLVETTSMSTIISASCIPYLLGAFAGYAPWLYVYQQHTGRWLPNAWPSLAMLQASAFLRTALNQTQFFYLRILLEFSPLQVLGILFGLIVSLTYVSKHMWQYCHCTSRRNRINGDNFVAFGGSGHVCSLLMWPLAFIAGCTLVGALGGGYQSRFILPIIPATSILAARCIHRASSIRPGHSASAAAVHVLVGLSLAYSLIHCLFYGIMFTNLYADFEHSIFSIIRKLLAAPYHPMTSKESMADMLKFLSHFGVHLKQG